MKVGVIGCGVVGGAVKLGLILLGHKVSSYDIRDGSKLEDVKDTEVCFICVPTPQKEDGSCDTSIVELTVDNLKSIGYNGIVAIKSTVVPGTTKRLQEKHKDLDICFVPEFLREKSAFYDFTQGHDVCIIGTTSTTIFEKIKKTHGHFPTKFCMVGETEAELAKYFSNVYNAMKVTFTNAFYDVCKALGADYTEVKNAVVNRPTIIDMYLNCNENLRGFAGVCVIPETKVYTPGGLKRIDEIKIGDLVYTIDGSQQNVEDVLVRRVEDERMWRIKGQGVGEFTITSEHPVYAIKTNRCYKTVNGKLKLSNSKNENFEWVDAKDLEKGDMIALPKLGFINTSNEIEEDFARLLGYYAAEGSLENNSNRVSLSFHSKEDSYMEDIDYILGKIDIRSSISKNGNKAQQRFSSKSVREDMLRHVGKYSSKKELSKELLQSSIPVIENFLCGYFRGDGHLSENRFTVATISEKLFEGIKILLLRLGISFNVVERQKYKGQDGVVHSKAYYIKVSNYKDVEEIKRILQIKKDIRIPKFERKTSWFDIFGDKNLMVIPIKSIEKIKYTGEVYNLEVAGNNTYVVEDAIVHNCLPKDSAALAALADSLGIKASIFKTIVEDNKLYKPTVFDGMRLE